MKLPKFARTRSASSLSSTMHLSPSHHPATHYLCFPLAKTSRANHGSSGFSPNASASCSPAANPCPRIPHTAAATRNDGCNSASLPTAFIHRLPSNSIMQELNHAFAQFDANHDGKISADELCAVLQSLGFETTPQDAQLMVKDVDANGDGFIDLEEFMELHRDGMQEMPQNELRATFDIFDLNKDGHITAHELHAVLTNLGDHGHISLEDCDHMIRSVDRKGVGHVDLDDFKLMMMHF